MRLRVHWPCRSCSVRCIWPTPENGVRDVCFVSLLCPGLVRCTSSPAAVPNPDQQPMRTMYERLLAYENVDTNALLEGLLPAKISFPLLPPWQEASLEALLPIRLLHVWGRGFEK
jgi:hypothetical protein